MAPNAVSVNQDNKPTPNVTDPPLLQGRNVTAEPASALHWLPVPLCVWYGVCVGGRGSVTATHFRLRTETQWRVRHQDTALRDEGLGLSDNNVRSALLKTEALGSQAQGKSVVKANRMVRARFIKSLWGTRTDRKGPEGAKGTVRFLSNRITM